MKLGFSFKLLLILTLNLRGVDATVGAISQVCNVNIGSSMANYLNYHKRVIQIENRVVAKEYETALAEYAELFSSFDFIFLRDYQVASQLAFLSNNQELGKKYIELGISSGWSLKSIKNNKFLRSRLGASAWKEIKSNYEVLAAERIEKLNLSLRLQVHQMFKRDQKMAIGAWFRLGDKAQERYGDEKFAPHSEKQIAELKEILAKYGYPGEQLIGNHYWMSTVVSHHNSISKNQVVNDTLFANVKPRLVEALKRGEISPFELALMEDWRTAVLSDHNRTLHGFVGAVQPGLGLVKVNENRATIGLRSVELRNKLVDVEEETGMKLYLFGGPWQPSKILPEGS